MASIARAGAGGVRHFSGSSRRAQVTRDTLNPLLLKADYAVRGSIVIRAMELEKAIQTGEGEKPPFEKIIFCNIGNPQSLKQKPLSFHRQVLSLLDNPDMLEDPVIAPAFPSDAKARARHYLERVPEGTGAYSASQGVEVVREEVAEFITKRDGFAAKPGNIFLTDGASPAVQMLVRAIIRDSNDACLIPIPQYPLYSASLALYGGSAVGYYTDEATNWGMNLENLEKVTKAAREEGKNVRAMAVINPGNPTGGCLSRDDMVAIIEFCLRENLVLMADEVYQENIWAADREFLSFKRVACELGVINPETDGSDLPEGRSLQLASFHSVSKGFIGECGRRGGYVELCGFEDDVKAELYKLASISLCSNVSGQIMVGLMVNPPKPGMESYDTYKAERDGILASLKRRATMLAEAFSSMDGISCQEPQGALYIFPRIELPSKAVDAAKEAGVAPDMLYARALLEATGVVVVPGSGFRQEEGTFHFRTTILPPEDEIATVVDSFRKFHSGFMAKYA